MSKSHTAFATIFLMIFLASAIIPIAFNSQPVTTVSLVESHHAPSATDYVVTVEERNELQAFNDDDFKFTVYNGSNPLNGAWVRLLNVTDSSLLYDQYTDGVGVAEFFDLPLGTYQWNVSHTADTTTNDASGQIVSNGPEADVNIRFGNLDWQNDQDDLNATIYDIEGKLANNLNFSILFSGNDSIWAQQEVVDGVVYFGDIPDGDYYWQLRVMYDLTYAGYLLDWGTIEANSTQMLVHQSIGPFAGNADYYDLEIFTYYETSFEPIIGAIIDMEFYNGTPYDSKVTPSNGTVVFIDLPIAFMNWSVTYLGSPIGQGDYSYNLTAPSFDIRDPIVTGPGNQDILIDAENVTISWHLEDEYPSSIKVYVDGILNITSIWNVTSYDYIFNVSNAFPEFVIGEYQVKLVATDQNLNSVENTTIIRFYEDVFPVIEGPEDEEFYFTETGYSLSWNVTDDYLNKYTITDNDDVVVSGDINPDNPVITISLDGLEIGAHNFTLAANDTSGNTSYDSVIVIVNADDTVPVLVYEPGAVTYSQGAANVVRNWTVTDDFKDNYTIAIDGDEIVSAAWETDNIEFDFSGLSLGVHEVVLTVYDIGGNTLSSTVTVTVTQAPIVTYLYVLAVGSIAFIVLVAIVWFVRYR